MTRERLMELEEERLAQGLSIASYTKSINFSKSQYHYWRRKYLHLAQMESKSAFLPLNIYGKEESRMSNCDVVNNVEIEMRTSSGAEFRLKGSFTAQMLASIIKSSSEHSDV